MLTAIGLYLIGVALALIWIMIRDHQMGRCELISVRNIAIVGFILFQMTSAAMTMFYGDWGPYVLTSPEWTSLEYAAMVSVFLPVALWAYNRGWFVRKLARRLPTTYAVPNDAGMLAMAVLLMLLAAGLRFWGQNVYLFGFVTSYVGEGMAAVSAGLAGWVWAKRFMNPAAALLAVMITAGNMFTVMAGAFGRRGLVAVGAGLLWGMYFSQWRHMPPRMFFKRLVLVSVPPILVVAAFTSVRENAPSDRSAGDYLRAMVTGGSIGKGLTDLMGGQMCAAGSMWLIESHKSGGGFEHRHLLTPWYFLVYPVPRALWESKPDPMGVLMPAYARMQGVVRDELNMGPGIIGNAGCEGGWYALIIYAILGGLFLRFFDEAARASGYSPFVVLPLGSALGHILGLARGESSAFAALTVITVSGCLITMVLAGKLIESASGARSTVPELDEFDEFADAELLSDYPEYAQLATEYGEGDTAGRSAGATDLASPDAPRETA